MSGPEGAVAGFEFQFIWTAARALELIRPGTTLQAIVVEDIHPDDAIAFDSEVHDFHGVDLSEYHGGGTLQDASEVVVAQLKYGVKRSRRPWTVARLCAKSKKAGASVIRRLADAYGTLVSNTPGEQAEKVRVQLVTNRPLAASLRADLQTIQQTLLEAHFSDRTRAMALSPLAGKRKQDISRLCSDIGLTSQNTAQFLLAFDLSTFNRPSVESLQLDVARLVHSVNALTPFDGLRKLLEHIREEARARSRRPITASDVRVALGIPSEQDFLPAPCEIRPPAGWVQTAQATCVVDAVLERRSQQHRTILVHGDAGTGKSSTLTTLRDSISQQSFCVIYDCFGGGEASVPHRRRHTAEAAIVQINNELAIQSRQLRFLSRSSFHEATAWARLEETIRHAAEQAAKAKGLVVLAIDAADNAAVACSDTTPNEVPFFQYLWNLRLPANVRLVISCRSHRRHLLDAPAHVEEVHLPGFTLPESTQHAAQLLPNIDATSAQAFHDATNGVPRLQYYWLRALEQQRPDAALQAIASRRTSGLEELYDDWMAQASTVVPDGTLCSAILAVQSRPLSAHMLARAAQVEFNAALRFLRGLRPGIVAGEGDQFHFRDEDFETHLRDRSAPRLAAGHAALADVTTSCSTPQEVQSVGRHLYHAQRFDELYVITVEERGIDSLTSTDVANACAIDRCSLSLCALSQSAATPSLLVTQLLYQVAEHKQREEVLSRVVSSRVDVAAAYGAYEPVLAALATAGYRDDFGALHFGLALGLCERGQLSAARHHLELGRAWLHQATSHHADAIHLHCSLAINGSAGAAAQLAGFDLWRAVEAAYDLATRPNVPTSELVELRKHVRAAVAASLLAGDLVKGRPLRKRAATTVLQSVADSLSSQPPARQVVPRWFLGMLALAARTSSDLFAQLSAHVNWTPPDEIFSGQYPERLFVFLTALSIRSVVSQATWEAESLVPSTQPPRSEDEVSRAEVSREEHERMRRVRQIASLKPLFMECGSRLVTGSVHSDLREVVNTLGQTFERDTHLLRRILAEAGRAMAASTDTPTSEASTVLQATETLPIEEQVATGASIVADVSEHADLARTVEDHLDATARAVQAGAVTASTTVELLLALSAGARHHSDALARHLYSEALAATAHVALGRGDIIWALCTLSSPGDDLVPGAVDDRATAATLVRAVDFAASMTPESRSFPWDVVAHTVCALCAPVGLQACGTWERRRWVRWRDLIPPAVLGLLAGNRVGERHLVHLLSLGEAYPDLRAAQRVLDRLWDKDRPSAVEALDHLAETWCRRAEDDGEDPTSLLEWADRRGQNTRPSLITLCDRLDSRHAREHTFEHQASDLERLIVDYPSRAFAAFEAHKSELPTLLQVRPELVVSWCQALDSNSALDLVTRLEKLPYLHANSRATVERLVWLLRALRKLPKTSQAEESYRRIAESLVEVAARQPRVITRKALSELIRASHPSHLARFVSENLSDLDSSQLFFLAAASTPNVGSGDATELSAWLLHRYFPSVRTTPSIPHTSNAYEAIAGLLFDQLSHPIKWRRWKAIHVARRMVATRAEPLLEQLVAQLDRQDSQRWMSGREWLAFLLYHLSLVQPGILAPYVDALVAHVTNDDFPHADIRELLKRALQATIAHPPVADSVRERVTASVTAVNEPVGHVRRIAGGLGRTAKRTRRSWRFHFDSIDTFPYWYSPLAHCFNLHRCDVAERAEHWIVDRWAISDVDCRADRESMRDFPHHHVSNDHGSPPAIELLHKYAEWHGMQLAAGELVRTTPAVGEEEYGSWREWIDGAFGADPWITSRLRRPVPLDVLSKVEAGASRPQTEIEISGHNDPWLVLASHWSAYEGRSLRLSVSVDSAVVPAELAGSLAVALLSYERRFDYALPRVELSYRLDLGEVVRILADETIDLRQENTISDGDFHLTPWYVAWSSERSEHSTDSEWPASTRLLYLPGERFLRRFSAYLDTGSLDAIANGTRIAQPHAWVYSGDYTSEHSGTRLCVERSSMAGYLSECEAVLIVEASVEDGESEQREIFILNSEGELSSMGTRQVERPRSY